MRAKIIAINWSMSLFGLGMESADGGMLWALVGFTWFGLSTLLLIMAEKKGALKKIEKRFKIDEL